MGHIRSISEHKLCEKFINCFQECGIVALILFLIPHENDIWIN